MLNQKGNQSFILGGIILLIVTGAGIYYFRDQNPLEKSVPLKASAAPEPSQESALNTSDWSEYINTKYNFSIEYPQNFKVGDYNGASGELKKGDGNENKIGFYQDNDTFKNFLEIQVFETSNTLRQAAEDNYQENKGYSPTKKSSELMEATILGYPSISYTFTGSVLKTRYWSGLLSEENEFKVIFIEKDQKIYSIYFTNNQLFEKIYNSLKFI